MLHGLGDCTPGHHCGCLTVPTLSSRDVVRNAVQAAVKASSGRRAKLVLAALDPILTPLENLADLVRREHVPATMKAVTYCEGCGVLLDEQPCPYLETLAGRMP